MRGDQVFDLRAQLDRESGDAVAGFAHHHHAERDVADEIAVARVAAGAAFVGELLQLADVVQHHAGEDEIFVRAVGARDQAADLGHLRDVLEEAAAIRVMNLLRGRPDPQLRFVVGDDAIQQDADVIVLDAAEMLLQLRPHLVDRTRRAEDASSSRNPCWRS